MAAETKDDGLNEQTTMKKMWEEKLRRKLEGHRKTPPEGLWEGISEQMGLTPESASKPAAKRWLWVAAAVAMALVGIFALYKNGSNVELKVAESGHHALISEHQETTPLVGRQKRDETPVLAHAQTNANTPSKTLKDKVSNPKPVEYEQPSASQSINLQPTSSVDDTEVKETHLLPKENDVEKPSDTPINNQDLAPSSDRQTTKHQKDTQPTRSFDEWNRQKSTAPPSHQWSFGVNASGGLLAAQTTNQTTRIYNNSFADDDDIDGHPYADVSPSYSLTDKVWEHHLPVRFGVSLSRQLSPRLALQSGINYTYLFSRSSIPLYPNIVTDQKLHYLGIPIGLSYQLWETNHINLYATGGVMVEKCLNDKPWQWSTNASLGAEYDISKQFGFYVEPSLGYYFDDGTSLEHYYKEHPLTPSIEFGLRLHLNE